MPSVFRCNYFNRRTETDMIDAIAKETKVNHSTVAAVVKRVFPYILHELLSGNVVTIHDFCTFMLRRREYSPVRQQMKINGRFIYPPFCYYPYAHFYERGLVRNTLTEKREEMEALIGHLGYMGDKHRATYAKKRAQQQNAQKTE